MAPVTVRSPEFNDALLIKLAREIAMEINELEDVLKSYSITPEQFERIKSNPRFLGILQAEITAWQSALNTDQRIKVKAASMLELWLEEAHARLHDRSESLAAKTELAKFLGRLNNLGVGGANVTGEVGEKFSITINLGADNQVKFEKTLPAQVIEHDPTPVKDQ
jgi:hypothetical protein